MSQDLAQSEAWMHGVLATKELGWKLGAGSLELVIANWELGARSLHLPHRVYRRHSICNLTRKLSSHTFSKQAQSCPGTVVAVFQKVFINIVINYF